MNNVGSFVILTRKRKTEIFLVKRSDFPIWEFQGGGMEKYETPEKTAIREALEESGFNVKIIKRVAEYSYNKKITKYLFEGQIISGEYKPEYEGCEGKWFKINRLPWSMTTMGKRMIKDYLLNSNNVINEQDEPIFSIKNVHLFFLNPVAVIKFILNKTI